MFCKSECFIYSNTVLHFQSCSNTKGFFNVTSFAKLKTYETQIAFLKYDLSVACHSNVKVA